MKCYILLITIVLTVAGVRSDWKEDMQKIDAACREQSKVSEDEVKAFFKGEAKGEAKDAFKCHVKCLMEKQGKWKNGAFDDVAAKKMYESIPALKDHMENINKSLDECKNQKGANECDTAFMITKCMVDKKSNWN